jgi:hypothetical protein
MLSSWPFGRLLPAAPSPALHPLQVFFKMDKTGEGEEVRLCDLPLAKELAFQGFGHDLFQEVGRLRGQAAG